jgi:hypothetical protein
MARTFRRPSTTTADTVRRPQHIVRQPRRTATRQAFIARHLSEH